VFDTDRAADVLRLRRPGTEWLSTGPGGGRTTAPAGYLLTVPEGFDREDIADYVAERRRGAGFDEPGPALLTGVHLEHARGARLAPAVAVATAGVSNPAALPVDGERASAGRGRSRGGHGGEGTTADGEGVPTTRESPGPGTVNVVVGTTRALADGALANLVAVAAEAKAATLLGRTGFPGTTTDAVLAAHDPAGEPAAFSGSATAVGAAARACVRAAVGASLRSRYAETDPPASVADAEHGVVTDDRATVFEP